VVWRLHQIRLEGLQEQFQISVDLGLIIDVVFMMANTLRLAANSTTPELWEQNMRGTDIIIEEQQEIGYLLNNQVLTRFLNRFLQGPNTEDRSSDLIRETTRPVSRGSTCRERQETEEIHRQAPPWDEPMMSGAMCPQTVTEMVSLNKISP
jgi:hypothetical protein